jgi:double-stranded uracil-DNA glycosylase
MVTNADRMATTLTDILAPNLKVVFVGINPSVYSVAQGHYFARSANRFWAALSGSRLSLAAREELGRAILTPDDDLCMRHFGFGFTDIVKAPTASAAELRVADFAVGAPQLRAKLEHLAPQIACFQGATALRPFLRHALGVRAGSLDFGMQPNPVADTAFFLTPNPSPANARFRLDDLVGWFDVLADALDTL